MSSSSLHWTLKGFFHTPVAQWLITLSSKKITIHWISYGGDLSNEYSYPLDYYYQILLGRHGLLILSNIHSANHPLNTNGDQQKAFHLEKDAYNDFYACHGCFRLAVWRLGALTIIHHILRILTCQKRRRRAMERRRSSGHHKVLNQREQDQ